MKTTVLLARKSINVLYDSNNFLISTTVSIVLFGLFLGKVGCRMERLSSFRFLYLFFFFLFIYSHEFYTMYFSCHSSLISLSWLYAP